MLAVIIINYGGETSQEEPTQMEDDLAEYRNMSTEELLRMLNEEKGFKELHPLKEFEMIAESYSFEPDEINVKLNDRIRITITAIDTNHSIRIPGFFIERDIILGEDEIIEFIASKTGEFIFYSTEDDNMKGKIVVEE